jgi:hypothetical protein
MPTKGVQGAALPTPGHPGRRGRSASTGAVTRRTRTVSFRSKNEPNVTFIQKKTRTNEERIQEMIRRLPHNAHVHEPTPTPANAPVPPAPTASATEPAVEPWYPGNPDAVRVAFHKSDRLVLQECLITGLFTNELADSDYCTCEIQRSGIKSRTEWDRVLKVAVKVTPDIEEISTEDAKAPGLLTVYIDREQTTDPDGNVCWTVPTRWADDKQPLKTISDELRKYAPKSYKEAVTVMFRRPALTLQVDRDELAAVIAQATLLGLGYKLNKSPTSCGFLEITSPPDLTFAVGNATSKALDELRTKYPGVILVPSSIRNGSRVIAMTTQELTWRDTFFFTKANGLTYRFYIGNVAETPAQISTANKTFVKEATGLFAEQEVKAFEAEAKRSTALRAATLASEEAEDDVEATASTGAVAADGTTAGATADDEAADATMTVTAADVADGVPATQREAFFTELVVSTRKVDEAFKKFTAFLSSCHVSSTNRRAAVTFAAQSMPDGVGAREAYLDRIAALTAVCELQTIVASHGKPDKAAAAAFSGMITPKEEVGTDGNLFGTAWLQKAKLGAQQHHGKFARSVTTTTTTTHTNRKATAPSPNRGGLRKPARHH